MKTGDMSRSEVKGILYHIKDSELRAELAKILRNELVGSRNSSTPKHMSDLGRLRR